VTHARSSPGPIRGRRARAAFIAGVVFGVAALAGAAWWQNPPDPEAELRAHHRPLVTLERKPAPQLGRGFERWLMIAPGPDTMTALWRPGIRTDARPWVAVILGGIGTDDRAAALVPDSLPIGVLAVSWPWKGSRRMGHMEFLGNARALRAALLRTPGALARGVEAVRRAVPGARVALVGASLGVAPAVASVTLARPDAVALVDGAADLGPLLRRETHRVLGGGIAGVVLAPPAAAFAARLLSSLEPSHFGAATRDLPVLLLDATDDERYPPECIARLHATFPHATGARHPGAHMRPEDRGQIAAIIDRVWTWLRGLPRRADAAARSGGLFEPALERRGQLVVAAGALAVNHQRERPAAHVEPVGVRGVNVQRRDRVLLRERPKPVALLGRERHHGEPAGSEVARDPVHVRQLVQARTAPRRPQVEDDDLALQVAEPVRGVVRDRAVVEIASRLVRDAAGVRHRLRAGAGARSERCRRPAPSASLRGRCSPRALRACSGGRAAIHREVSPSTCAVSPRSGPRSRRARCSCSQHFPCSRAARRSRPRVGWT